MLHCRDCNFKGKKAVAGACPACGSRNISSIKEKLDKVEPKKSHPLKTIAMTLLWGFFIYKIYEQFVA